MIGEFKVFDYLKKLQSYDISAEIGNIHKNFLVLRMNESAPKTFKEYVVRSLIFF